jgi:hypothetical protein
METWVSPLKEKFYRRSCTSKTEGIARFYQVWGELSPEKINKTTDSYPGRLHELAYVTKGASTKF